MRGLVLALALGASAQAQEAASPDPAYAPPLPPGLAADFGEDHSGDPAEGRSLSNRAMAAASGAYMTGDYRTALIHAERAAAAGEPRGATLAGHIRLHGLAGAADPEAAVRWLKRAAAQGEVDALLSLARLAKAERGGLSAFEARRFLADAADTGDARAALEFGLYLKETGDPGEADLVIDWLRLAAEAGHTPAFFEYALTLDQWVHGPGDPRLALPWYERAAQTGDADAALQAGLMRLSGEAGDPDPSEGFALVRQAAELGHPGAMGQYALLLFQGGPAWAANGALAADFARRGARAGDPESQLLYAYALATADGTPRDLEAAYVWVRRAAAGLPDDPQRRQLEAGIAATLSPEARARAEAEAAIAPGL